MNYKTKKDLLVLIGCIVFLIMTVGAVGPGGRQRAKSALCRAHLRQWGFFFDMYSQDNNGKFMRGWMDNEDGTWGRGKQWMNQLRPYYFGVENLRLCPMTPMPKEDWVFGGAFNAWSNLTGTADDATLRGEYGSYGMNVWAYNPPPNVPLWASTYSDYWHGPNVTDADNVPLFFDCIWTDAMPNDDCDPPSWDDYAGEVYSWAGQMQRICIMRHRSAINMLFMDYSVRRIDLKQLWQLKWYPDFDTNGYWTTPDADWPDWMKDF